MSKLSHKKCLPCIAGAQSLKGEELKTLEKELESSWKVIEEHHLEKTFKFKNFKEAMDFAVAIGHLADAEGHHPDLLVSWGSLKVTLWTHKIQGLSEADFILASKIDILNIAKHS